MMNICKKSRYLVAGSCFLFSFPAYALPYNASQQNNLLLIPISANASQTNELAMAKTFIQSMGDDVISYISDSNKTSEEKRQKLQEVLNKNFDLNTISRFAIGHYWNDLNDLQKAQYKKLYEEKIVSVYADKFSNYSGQTFATSDARKTGSSDYTIDSKITTTEGTEIPVSWQLRNKGGDFKIIDVAIEGVSMIVTQKSDFSSAIQRNGGKADVILDYLKQ